MRRVGKAALHSDGLGPRTGLGQQRPRELEPAMLNVTVQRDAGSFAERPNQISLTESRSSGSPNRSGDDRFWLMNAPPKGRLHAAFMRSGR
jgi:hypothetical protein